MPSKKPVRLGRPPASSSADTRARILQVACECFAELGYGMTTNRHVATQAGITTAALYHYFDSKVAIYAAVYRHVTDVVFDRFDAAIVGVDTFIGRFEAMLEEAHRLDAEDPSLARFLASAGVDVMRHADIRPALGRVPQRSTDFRRRLVDHGVDTGEIPAEHRDMVSSFIQIVLVGLTDGRSGDIRKHRVAVDSVRAVLEGTLLVQPAASKRQPAASVRGRGTRTTSMLPSDHSGTSTRRAIRQPASVRTRSSS